MQRDEVVRVAREKMGSTSRMATGEWGMLARLLEPGERIDAMVIAQPGRTPLRSGTLLALTDRRLLQVAKAMITRRERIAEVPRSCIRGARLESATRLVIEQDDGDQAWAFAQPPRQAAALVASILGHEDRFPELNELARRKLGKVMGFGVEGELMVLASLLGPDEGILDLAWAGAKPQSLIALTSERVVLIRQQGLRAGPPPDTLPFTDLGAVSRDGDTLILGDRRLEQLIPENAAEIIAGRLEARLPSRG